MPKVKWIGGKKPPVKGKKPYNALAALLRGHKLAAGLTSEEIGAALGISPDHVRHQIGQPAEKWKIGTLLKYCDILGIPYEDAMSAAIK